MDWLKKNQKKVLAVLGVLLMVGFLVNPSVTSLTGGGNSRGRMAGKLGKEPIYYDELRSADAEWRMLARSMTFDFSRGRFRQMSVLEKLGDTILSQKQAHPEFFLLLYKEAERRGIRMSDDVVLTAIHNREQNLPIPDQSSEAEFKSAARHYLEVLALREQLNCDVKISDPMWQRYLAENNQQMSLDLVEFTADRFQHAVKPPTTQQVQSLFEIYRDVEKSAAARQPQDPLGLAYQVPNRVKLQYIAVSHQQLMDAVKAGKDRFELDFDAQKYYLRNQGKFVRPAPPATAPATSPATQAAATQPAAATQIATTQPATTQPAATTQASATQPAPATQAAAPTTRPFAEVKEEILDTILAPQADALQKQIDDTLHARLAADFAAYHRLNPTGPATRPTTQPIAATAPATGPVDYTSFAYLEQLALEIQRQFAVLPQVHQIGEWEDATQLAAEPGIGASEANGQPFPQAATDLTSLQLWQPSPTFTAPDKSIYDFRLTDRSPAHAPDLADVRARVEADALTSAAYDAANEAATKFVDAAKRSGFVRAALDDQHAIISTGNFDLSRLSMGIPNFHANEQATEALAMKAHDLLTDASPANPHPMAIIPMPSERKVVVAQLGDLVMVNSGERLASQKLTVMSMLQTRISETLAQSYFSFKAVSDRLAYQPEAKPADSGS